MDIRFQSGVFFKPGMPPEIEKIILYMQDVYRELQQSGKEPFLLEKRWYIHEGEDCGWGKGSWLIGDNYDIFPTSIVWTKSESSTDTFEWGYVDHFDGTFKRMSHGQEEACSFVRLTIMGG